MREAESEDTAKDWRTPARSVPTSPSLEYLCEVAAKHPLKESVPKLAVSTAAVCGSVVLGYFWIAAAIALCTAVVVGIRSSVGCIHKEAEMMDIEQGAGQSTQPSCEAAPSDDSRVVEGEGGGPPSPNAYTALCKRIWKEVKKAEQESPKLAAVEVPRRQPESSLSLPAQKQSKAAMWLSSTQGGEKKRGAVTAEALELDRERKHAAHPPHSPEWECGASQPAVEGPQTHQDLVHDGGAEAIYTTLNSTTQNGCSGGILRPESPATQCRASVMEERKSSKEMLSVFFGAVRDAWAVASESTVTPQRETASSSIRSAMRQFWVRA